MAVWGITIQNTGSDASVNSGNPIWLAIDSIDPHSVGRHNQAEKSNADALVKGDTQGRKIPSMTLNGHVNWRKLNSAVVNGLTCSAATPQLLHALVNLSQSTNSQIFMLAAWGWNSSGAQWLRNFANDTSGMNIIIDDLVWHLKSDGEQNHIWEFSLPIREVAPE